MEAKARVEGNTKGVLAVLYVLVRSGTSEGGWGPAEPGGETRQRSVSTATVTLLLRRLLQQMPAAAGEQVVVCVLPFYVACDVSTRNINV